MQRGASCRGQFCETDLCEARFTFYYASLRIMGVFCFSFLIEYTNHRVHNM